jgi:hypothetical protein
MHIGFWWGNLKRYLTRDRISWGGNINVNFTEQVQESTDWIQLSEDMENCQAFMNAVLTSRGQ